MGMVVISISAANIRDKDDDYARGWHSWCHQFAQQTGCCAQEQLQSENEIEILAC